MWSSFGQASEKLTSRRLIPEEHDFQKGAQCASWPQELQKSLAWIGLKVVLRLSEYGWVPDGKATSSKCGGAVRLSNLCANKIGCYRRRLNNVGKFNLVTSQVWPIVLNTGRPRIMRAHLHWKRSRRFAWQLERPDQTMYAYSSTERMSATISTRNKGIENSWGIPVESLDTELLSRTKLRSTSGTMYLVYFVTLTHWWKVELSDITFPPTRLNVFYPIWMHGDQKVEMEFLLSCWV